jgi:hypothetical protein
MDIVYLLANSIHQETMWQGHAPVLQTISL